MDGCLAGQEILLHVVSSRLVRNLIYRGGDQPTLGHFSNMEGRCAAGIAFVFPRP